MRTIRARTEFLATTTAQAFADAVASPAFVIGVRFALFEFMIAEPRGTTWEAAARSQDYQQGAKDFAQYLLTFTDSEPEKPQPANENLKWPTKQSLQPRHPPLKGQKP
jgi:hypothetical protein